MYSYRPLHMAEQNQGDQLAPTYSSSVRIRGVALRTCQKRWTTGRGGERGSGISVLMARQYDDDNGKVYQFISLFFFFYFCSMVRRYSKIYYSEGSLSFSFFFFITRSGRLAEIGWYYYYYYYYSLYFFFPL